MTKVLRILSTTKKYGGDLFEDDMQKSWERQGHRVDVVNPVPEGSSRLQKVPAYLNNLVNLKDKSEYDYVIRAMNHVFFMEKQPKQLVIAYHYDTAFCHPLVKAHHYLTLKSLVANKDKVHRLIVISQFWKDYFFSLGFKNIETIYCGYDQKEFQLDEAKLEKFKTQHGFQGKKVIYIGNSQRKKGADIVYQQLKDEGYLLVTSGNKDVELPCLNLQLPHEDYLYLLKSSSAVVTYSQFKEGWNRVAHEAMLMGVPVIGSGLGGMGELLQGGKQKVVHNPKDLSKALKEVLINPEIGELGREYAAKFTMEKFSRDCNELLKT